jgi:hypothetical protein
VARHTPIARRLFCAELDWRRLWVFRGAREQYGLEARLVGPKGAQEAKVEHRREGDDKGDGCFTALGRQTLANRARWTGLGWVVHAGARHRGCWRSSGTRLGHTRADNDRRILLGAYRGKERGRGGDGGQDKDRQQRASAAPVLFCMNR